MSWLLKRGNLRLSWCEVRCFRNGFLEGGWWQVLGSRRLRRSADVQRLTCGVSCCAGRLGTRNWHRLSWSWRLRTWCGMRSGDLHIVHERSGIINRRGILVREQHIVIHQKLDMMRSSRQRGRETPNSAPIRLLRSLHAEFLLPSYECTCHIDLFRIIATLPF